MNKKHLNGVYKIGEGEKASIAYVRNGSIMEISDPQGKRFIGQPLKTYVRWRENQERVNDGSETLTEDPQQILSTGGTGFPIRPAVAP